MFNDRLSDGEAKERIDQRLKEVENYSRQKILGYSEQATTRWIFGILVLITTVTASLLI